MLADTGRLKAQQLFHDEVFWLRLESNATKRASVQVGWFQ
jgi:hypothetical protein